MKIPETRTGSAAPVRPARGAPGARPAAPARAVADSASIMGIPEAELTPKVREAILALMAEVDRLRREVERSQARIAHLEKLADEDTLAPIANRRAFVRELARFLAFADRYGTPSSVIYFDVNGLKRINDGHGHLAGDAALVCIANTLLANVRKSDVVGRMGGDEFAVLLFQADENTALDKARAMVAKIEQQSFAWNGVAIPLSAAFGVHTFKGGEDTAATIEAADRAMYERKRRAEET